MNDIDREIHRALATVRKINQRGITCLECSVSSFGAPLRVTEWLNTKPHEELSIGRQWVVYPGDLNLANVQRVNRELRAVLSGSQVEEVAA